MAIRYKSLILYYRERYIFLFVNVALASVLFSLVIVFLRLFPAGQIIPLHYDIFFGIDRIGNRLAALIPVATGVSILLINFVLGFIYFPKNRYISYYAALLSSIANIVILIYFIVLISYAY